MASGLPGFDAPVATSQARSQDLLKLAAPAPHSSVVRGYGRLMTKWEYVTVPVLVHATKQILDNWGEDGWELVQVVPGLNPENLVAYLKRPKA